MRKLFFPLRKELLKIVIKKYLLFLIIETFLIKSYQILSPNCNITNFVFGTSKIDFIDVLSLTNKLFIIFFLIYLTLSNYNFLSKYSLCYLTSRASNYHIWTILFTNTFLNVLYFNILQFLLCFLLHVNSTNLNIIYLLKVLIIECLICNMPIFISNFKNKRLILLLLLMIFLYLNFKLDWIFLVIGITIELLFYLKLDIRNC